MDAPREAARRVPPVRSRGNGRSRAPSVRRQSDRRERDLELSQRRRSGAIHTRPQEPRSGASQASGCGRSQTCAGAQRQEACPYGSADTQGPEVEGQTEETHTRPEKKVAKV